MSKVLRVASVFSLALSTVAALAVTDATFATEDENASETVEEKIFVDPDKIVESDGIVFSDTKEVVQSIDEADLEADRIANAEKAAEAENTASAAVAGGQNASSLRELVGLQSTSGSLSKEMQCLAGTVYFESKGEVLAGQLAVARVVLARKNSSRFPNSICGVVFQRKQFSFIRNGQMPRIDKGHRHWRNAVAISKIAVANSWKSPVEGALFFHARYVSPGWRLKRMARIDNHIFYR